MIPTFAKRVLYAIQLSLLGTIPALAGETVNTTDPCEIVLIETVEDGANLARYLPAQDFLDSVYDEEPGHVEKIDDLAIRAVMCTRETVIPTLRDFPILATGIPLSLSENFDSPDSNLLTVYFNKDAFNYKYSGVPLDEPTQAELADRMELFNLQPHDLKTKSETP